MLVATKRINNIPNLLEGAGMSIYRLAKEVGMEYKSVHTIVSQDAIPPHTKYGTLIKFADALDVSIDELETEVEE